MPQFTYTARTLRGEALQGVMEGANAQAVASQLLSKGITPIEISSGPAASLSLQHYLRQLNQRLSQKRPGIDDLIFFSRQLHTLLKAGVAIVRSFHGLADNVRNPHFGTVLREVATQLESGRDLATALAKYPSVFNNLFVSMVQVGERSGDLDGSLLKLSQYLDREKDTRDRIKQAMRYPAIVMGAIVVAITVINLWVMPTFAKIFEKFHTELPWQTKMLIGSSLFMQHYWPLLLVGIAAAVYGLRRYLATEPGRLRWDRMKLKIPIIGVILYEALLARFATSFALTLRSGVPLLQGLAVVSHAVDNAYVGEKIRLMRTGIERGDTLTRTAANTEMFTPLTLQMLSVGEETGLVDDMLQNVALYYDREVEYKLKNLSSAIEPILIVIVGAMVLILALGVFLPMWELTSVIRK
ncbi:MAG: type II secretion system F family protein [Gammaproteobacteria bacterium]|nr:type II secretion system F family protein [Gammaproteobacteria bacterium]